MIRRALSCAAVAAALLATARTALADRVAVLPARGGTDEAARSAAQAEVARGLAALGHTPAPDSAVAAALKGVADGVADTADEYRAVGAQAGADWVLAATVEPAVTTTRVELTAYLASTGRVESVAREVDRSASLRETQEMLAVLLRPEGVGAGALPWEQPAPSGSTGAPPASPVAAAPLVVPPVPEPPRSPPAKRVLMAYPLGPERVWPAYSGGRRLALSASLGAAVAAARLEGASGSAASMVGGVRLAYAVGDRGFELFAGGGGNLAGPPAGWIEGGARLLLTPSLAPHDGAWRASPLHLGPSIQLGAFFRAAGADVVGPGGATYRGDLAVHPALGASLDVVFALSRSAQLEAQLGNLRWIPTADGALLLVGATFGAGLRF
ncbi:hypothetical protein SOCE26_096560 [Sorangium cellulosum]|uniref:Secreted protein n=1 Tax=Sorangium cellulosum TaxID=56 RepID=A0A2L0F965_SORCE|nr:hypothetical protein [Sorangium cellulosum]AUX48126.1 hypothetical protein SOCE26_096560 [Sorangium cellulosum]